jgi:(2Fe-2S) ferredoxin
MVRARPHPFDDREFRLDTCTVWTRKYGESMEPYEVHIFVCTSGGSCPLQGAEDVHAYLREAVQRAKLKTKVRVNHSGCLDQCGHGPVLVVYPENVWYSHVTVEEAETIFTRHILGGRPVDDLRFQPPGPGAHKLAKTPEGRPTERCTLCRGGRAVTAGYVGAE